MKSGKSILVRSSKFSKDSLVRPFAPIEALIHHDIDSTSLSVIKKIKIF